MSEPRPRLIRVQPELVEPVLNGRLSVPFRLWVVCRAIDQDGSGWLTFGQLRSVWHQSTRTIKTVLKRGQGLFWNCDSRRGNAQRIHLRSLANVCIALNVIPNKRPCLLEFDVTKSLRTFNAALYAVWISTAKDGRTIARESLMRIHGKSRQTLRSWEKTAHVRIRRNVARAKVTEPVDWLNIPRRSTEHGFWREGDYIYWQLPSTYHARFPVAGRPRKASAKVKQQLAICNAQVVNYHRMYWHDEAACYRAINRGNVSDHAYLHTGKTFGTRHQYAIWDHTYSADEYTWTMIAIHAREAGEAI